jgi:AAA family ATP:ADP antiporter
MGMAMTTPASGAQGFLQAGRAGVQPGEGAALAAAFLQFFCILAAYYVIRPVRDQFSAAVGSANLLYFWTATLVVMLLLTPVFGALVARWRREQFIPAIYGFFVFCLLGFMPLFAGQAAFDPRVFGAVFYVWVSVFNLFVVSVFWSFMADLFDSGQAKRLFPMIALGGTTGAIAGPLATGLLVERIGIAPLLAVSAALLAIAIGCTLWLSAWARKSASAAAASQDEAIGGDWLAGARQVLAGPFLRKMALLMLLGDAVGTVAYALVADYVQQATPDRDARTALYAHLDLATNTLQVVLQVFVTRWLLQRRGTGATLVVASAVNVVVLLVAALVGGPAILAVLVLTRGMAYGVVKPAQDALYTRVSREVRYKGKNFIETAVWRLGDVSVALLMKGSAALGIGMAGLALASAGAAGLAGLLGWRAARMVEPSAIPEP